MWTSDKIYCTVPLCTSQARQKFLTYKSSVCGLTCQLTQTNFSSLHKFFSSVTIDYFMSFYMPAQDTAWPGTVISPSYLSRPASYNACQTWQLVDACVRRQHRRSSSRRHALSTIAPSPLPRRRHGTVCPHLSHRCLHWRLSSVS